MSRLKNERLQTGFITFKSFILHLEWKERNNQTLRGLSSSRFFSFWLWTVQSTVCIISYSAPYYSSWLEAFVPSVLAVVGMLNRPCGSWSCKPPSPPCQLLFGIFVALVLLLLLFCKKLFVNEVALICLLPVSSSSLGEFKSDWIMGCKLQLVTGGPDRLNQAPFNNCGWPPDLICPLYTHTQTH